MAEEILYAKVGGATSGPCTSPSTAGTLKYVLETNALWSNAKTVRVMHPNNGDAHEIDFSARILCDAPLDTPFSIVGANEEGWVDGTQPHIAAVGTWSKSYTMLVLKGRHLARLQNLNLDGDDKAYNLINNSGAAYGTFTDSGETVSQSNTTTSDWYLEIVDCTLQKSKHHAASCFGGPDGAPAAKGLYVARCYFYACGLVGGGSGIVSRPLTGLNPRLNFEIYDSFFDRCQTGVFANVGTTDCRQIFARNWFNNSVARDIQITGTHQGQMLIYDNVFCGLGSLSNSTSILLSPASRNANARIFGNIFHTKNTAISDSSYDSASQPSPAIYHRNWFYNNITNFVDDTSDEASVLPGYGNVSGLDPGLVNTSASSFDGRLRLNSLAVLRGWKAAGVKPLPSLALHGVPLKVHPYL